MAIYNDKIEFDLTIKKFKDNNAYQGRHLGSYPDHDWEETEKLEFKTLSAKEVLRKLIDYLS